MFGIVLLLLQQVSAIEVDSSSAEVCAEALFNIYNRGIFGPFTNSTSERDVMMALYSGVGLNDLGNYQGCQYRTDRANYVLSYMSLYGIPARYSLCLPEECTYEILNKLFANIKTEIPELEDQYSENRLNYTNPFAYREVGIVPTPNEYLPIVFVKDKNDGLYNHWNPLRTFFTVILFMILTICLVGTSIDLWAVHGRKVLADIQKKKLKEGDREHLINPSSIEPQIEMHSGDSPPDEEDNLMAPSPKYFETTTPGKLLLCFSFYSNFQKLFSNRSGSNADPLESLNAVRVMSMGWVIFGHVTTERLGMPQQNPDNYTHVLKQPNFAIVYGAFYAVDTFFWMSGLLMAFLFIKELQARDGKVNWGLVYFHRFWRLTPIYMFCLFLIWSYTRYCGDGPLWWMADGINNDCKEHWWNNLIYLNNFLPDYKWSGCMGWSWYLANDMQFFVISPPFLYLYHKVSRLIGWVVVAALIIIHILSAALISRHFHLNVVILSPNPYYMEYYYVKPYCRVGAYAVGIAVGMILFSFRHWKATGQVYDPFALKIALALYNSRIVRYLGLLIGLFFINFCIFIQYSAYKDVDNGFDAWNNAETWTFMGFDRVLVTTGLSLIFLPLLFGQFTLIAEFLCSTAWTPFARLNFSCYLIHYAVMNIYFYNFHVNVHFDVWTVWKDSIIVAALSYCAATIICLMVESPSMGLEKLLLRRGPPPQQVKNQTTVLSK